MEAPAPVPAPPPARSDARLLVYCAPSLGNAVEELGRRYQQSTGVEIVVSRVAVHDAWASGEVDVEVTITSAVQEHQDGFAVDEEPGGCGCGGGSAGLWLLPALLVRRRR